MVSDEGQMRAAVIMREAAAEMRASVDRIEAAVQRFAVLLEDGYGGNGLRLIELLETCQKASE